MDTVLLQDAATGSTARVAVELGCNCYEFRPVVDGRTIDVLDSVPEFASGGGRPSGSGIPILFPFPNRIRAGRFCWEGREYVLPTTDGRGNAIHGFCLDRPWRVTAQSEDGLTAEFQLSLDAPDRLEQWPCDFVIELSYRLRGTTLRADFRIANPGDGDLPWGLGTHPWFRLPLGADSEPSHCLIEAAADEEWELVNLLPTGRRKRISPEKDLHGGAYYDVLQMDDVLTGLHPAHNGLECLIIDEQAGLQMLQTYDSVFRELVVFTPQERTAVCLEPYTCVTDAITLQQQGVDAGLRVLAPGEEFRTWVEIHAGLVIV